MPKPALIWCCQHLRKKCTAAVNSGATQPQLAAQAQRDDERDQRHHPTCSHIQPQLFGIQPCRDPIHQPERFPAFNDMVAAHKNNPKAESGVKGKGKKFHGKRLKEEAQIRPYLLVDVVTA